MMSEGRLRRTAAAAVIVLGLALAAAGCGEKEERRVRAEPQEFELALDFYVNPDHAGIYTALDAGYFEQAGLDVTPRVPSDPSAPIKLVATGRADLAVSYEPEVLIARDQGLPVVAVAALFDRPLTSLISLPDAGIEDVDDLRGKTIATAGIPYQAAFLDAILDEERIDPDEVEQVEVGLGLLPAVLSGEADAMLGGFSNIEGVDLTERGRDPRVVPVDELGIPDYDELVLVANSDVVEDDPEAIRLFVAALERGTAAAADDPDAATDRILEAGQGLDPALTAAEVEATLPLLEGDGGRRPYGFMDPREWAAFAGFLADQGVVGTREAEGALTNEVLPARERD